MTGTLQRVPYSVATGVLLRCKIRAVELSLLLSQAPASAVPARLSVGKTDCCGFGVDNEETNAVHKGGPGQPCVSVQQHCESVGTPAYQQIAASSIKTCLEL